MKKTRLILSIIAVVVIVGVGVFLGTRAYYVRTNIGPSTNEQNKNQNREGTSQENASTVVTSSSNYDAVMKAIQTRTQRFIGSGAEFYYKMNFLDVYETTLDNQTIQFGKIGFEFGDGTKPDEAFYFLKTGGKLYSGRGYGWEPYPYEQTNWKEIKKAITVYNVVPLELALNSYDINLASQQDFEKQELLSQFIMRLDIDSNPMGVKAVSLLNSKEGTGPFKKLGDYSVVITTQNKNSINPAKIDPILPGRTNGQKTIAMNNEIFIKYPDKINGMGVGIEQEGGDSMITFRIEDEHQSYATLQCGQYRSPEVGDKDNSVPQFIDEGSQNQIIDWGVRNSRGYYSASFTTESEHCYFYTGGIMRPNMFKIGFIK